MRGFGAALRMFTPDGANLVSCAGDGRLRLWDYTVGDAHDPLVRDLVTAADDELEFTSVAVSEAQRRVLAGTQSGRLVVFAL